ncbi:MAG: imidazolonepropionase [Planctomycetota bacterium]
MAAAREAIDLLVGGAAEVVTGRGSAARGGRELGALEVHARGAVAIRGERIVAVGTEAELAARYAADRHLDAQGGVVAPGFVDAHTHPVFAATREGEFELRSRGASYVEIAAAGGGIASSVRGVRAAGKEELLALLIPRLDRFLELGTTTIEAKTGYGLTVADELKCLEVIAEANRVHAVDLVPTFLGGHDVPPEHRGDPERYVDLVVEEMLPRVAESGLARFFDVFTERCAFGIADSRRMLARAHELGFALRMHVDQFSPLGGAELAAELGAATADHLEHVSERGIAALAATGVMPVLCPLVPLYLRLAQEAPARRLIEAGLAPAISTDFNPGSSYVQSMPEILSWAALRYSMTTAECLIAATLNPASSLGLGADRGTLEPEKRADLVVLDVPNHLHLCYEIGRNPVRAVVKSGRVVVLAG